MRVVPMCVNNVLNSLTLYTWGTEEKETEVPVPQKGEKLAN